MSKFELASFACGNDVTYPNFFSSLLFPSLRVTFYEELDLRWLYHGGKLLFNDDELDRRPPPRNGDLLPIINTGNFWVFIMWCERQYL